MTAVEHYGSVAKLAPINGGNHDQAVGIGCYENRGDNLCSRKGLSSCTRIHDAALPPLPVDHQHAGLSVRDGLVLVWLSEPAQ